MKISDESTIVRDDKNLKSEMPKKETPDNGLSWQSVLVGGVPGLLLGSAGTLFATTPDESKEDPNEIAALKEEIAELKENVDDLQEQLSAINNHSSIPPIGDSVAVAHSVSEDMSFSEAFAAARAEVGPGGVFTWHGNVYGTYYANEWNNMSDSEKHDYADAVRHTDYNTDSVSNHAQSDYYHEASYGEGEIHVLGHDSYEIEDGQVINVAQVEIDGHYGELYDIDNDGVLDAAAIDVNDDGRPDVAMIDENGDGVIDQNEVYIVPDSSPDDALYADMPDYTNDADISNLV